MDTKFYTVTDISKLLKVSRQAVHKWIMEGKLKAYQVSSLYRIKEEDLETFIKLKDA